MWCALNRRTCNHLWVYCLFVFSHHRGDCNKCTLSLISAYSPLSCSIPILSARDEITIYNKIELWNFSVCLGVIARAIVPISNNFSYFRLVPCVYRSHLYGAITTNTIYIESKIYKHTNNNNMCIWWKNIQRSLWHGWILFNSPSAPQRLQNASTIQRNTHLIIMVCACDVLIAGALLRFRDDDGPTVHRTACECIHVCAYVCVLYSCVYDSLRMCAYDRIRICRGIRRRGRCLRVRLGRSRGESTTFHTHTRTSHMKEKQRENNSVVYDRQYRCRCCDCYGAQRQCQWFFFSLDLYS